MSMWSDLLEKGGDAIQKAANQRLQAYGQSAHIAAQEAVVQDFEALALTPYRNGQLSALQAAAKITQLDAAFTAYCRTLGYPRALNGAADVHALAVQIVQGLQGGAGAGAIPGGGAVGPGGLEWSTLALIGLGAYMILGRGR